MRVARALPALPRVCASFAAGRLSYSKVRAITRAANAGNEELLVCYGETATAAQLERVLRGYRSMSRLEDDRDAQDKFEQRSVRWWTDAEGFVRIEAKLAPDDGALVIGQLERMAKKGGEDEPAPAAPEAEKVPLDAAESGRGDAPIVRPRWAASRSGRSPARGCAAPDGGVGRGIWAGGVRGRRHAPGRGAGFAR